MGISTTAGTKYTRVRLDQRRDGTTAMGDKLGHSFVDHNVGPRGRSKQIIIVFNQTLKVKQKLLRMSSAQDEYFKTFFHNITIAE